MNMKTQIKSGQVKLMGAEMAQQESVNKINDTKQAISRINPGTRLEENIGIYDPSFIRMAFGQPQSNSTILKIGRVDVKNFLWNRQ